MPTYDYRCDSCAGTFSVQMAIRDRERGQVSCPLCRGTSTVPQYAPFFLRTSRKS